MAKFDSDEAGDAKYHAKKDDDLGEKNKCCGSNKGFIKTKDGMKCIGCGKVNIKESKFDQYLIEQKQLNEDIQVLEERIEDIIMENEELFEDAASIASEIGAGSSAIAMVISKAGATKPVAKMSDAEIVMNLLKSVDKFPNPKTKEAIKALGVKFADSIKKITSMQDTEREYNKAVSAPRKYADFSPEEAKLMAKQNR